MKEILERMKEGIPERRKDYILKGRTNANREIRNERNCREKLKEKK
jgi:hypothetical protein